MKNTTDEHILVQVLGEHASEIREKVGEWKAIILGEEVTITVHRLLTGANPGLYLATGSHSIKSSSQETSYQSVRPTDSIEAALRDWASGVVMFATPKAKMVKNR